MIEAFEIICLSLGLLWVRGLVGLLEVLWTDRRTETTAKAGTKGRSGPRPLKARSPEQCQECQAEGLPTVGSPSAKRVVVPWSARKGKMGRPKEIETEGYACANGQCEYEGVKEAWWHALVGCGHHGTQEPIQDLRCQACGVKFSVRRDTAFSHLKTPKQRVGEVTSALGEGLSPAAASRVFGYSERTINRWLSRAGAHAARVHAHFFQRLFFQHLQLDELRTTLRNKSMVVWLWLAFDVETKLIPAFELGDRTQALANRLIHQLKGRLNPDCVPLFTSDGLNYYFYALTAHFGHWQPPEPSQRKPRWVVSPQLWYGQLIKRRRRYRLVELTYRVPRGDLDGLQRRLRKLKLGRVLNTAFVERVNLTLRHSVSALSRRTWSTAQRPDKLAVHLQWWRAYYHFVRPHRALRQALNQPRARGPGRLAQRYRARTPAQAAGLTHKRWSAVELLSFPLPAEASR